FRSVAGQSRAFAGWSDGMTARSTEDGAAVPAIDGMEYGERLAALRREMTARGLDLALLSQPENVFYLTGLDHWGYFVPHLLVVPAKGEMVLVPRAMERVTVEHQAHGARFAGHSDSETAADAAARILQAIAPRRRV